MECNKDEATRAKDIAIRKFTAEDFLGAKKFALKAQNLFPGLEGISQMLATLDVHISAVNKVGGEMDLYGVLGVNPLADDDTIRKQYRKLLLLLHPDKNKSVGADRAFQFVSNAFTVLSDKAKRSAYDTQRHIKMANKVPSHSSIPVPKPTVPAGGVPHGANGHNKYPGSVSSSSRRKSGQKSGTQKASRQTQSTFQQGDTFWTVCARCKMQYEYMRVYLNQTLKCPNCNQAFVAVQTSPPSNLTPLQPEELRVHSSFGGSRTGWNSENQVGKESLKRDNTGLFSREGPSKRMREMGDRSQNLQTQRGTTGMGNVHGSGNYADQANGANGFVVYNARVNANRELSAMELKKMLAEKALLQMREVVSKSKLALEEKAAAKERAKVKQKEKQKLKLEKSMQEQGSHDKSSAPDENEQKQAPEFIVPDPDFHVFDHDRLERCFRENQVWAGYDNDDGMPRFYALIHEVVSLEPFELKLSWLNSRSNTEFSTLDWVGRGFSKTCGDFWVGKHETSQVLNSFSHRVKFEKGPRGVIQIYPRKGDIWALYRYWSPDWDQDIPDELIHVYDMVEVLQDYSDKQGVNVAPIMKVTGFRTVFHKQPDPQAVKHIPKEEMFRFSHQVPHHILTGNEKPNAPKGFIELDPAATPLELLQVTVANVDDLIDTLVNGS
ncbi:uncharacterized protein LOC141606464 [Silene latifolia]|uniref:uncharacterized protein LOC141606464 n=1 Tax=Silene latifolia TaxID=37657 RepID=UPI003D7808F1